MKWIFSILLLLVSSISFGQGFTYSYVDPCSKKLKVINIPNASSTVTVNYLGYVSTFTKDDFDNGNLLDGWVIYPQNTHQHRVMRLKPRPKCLKTR
jgi:hypothetical protein